MTERPPSLPPLTWCCAQHPDVPVICMEPPMHEGDHRYGGRSWPGDENPESAWRGRLAFYIEKAAR